MDSITIDRREVARPVDDAFRRDVLQGMAQAQKAVPARWFYDLRGSELFEEITRLPEYYPTRVETGLLKQRCADVARLVGSDRVVVEFGSGSSMKTPILLRHVEPSAYVPIDISGAFLRHSADELRQVFPGLPILPVEADFMKAVPMPSGVEGKGKLGFFPGSTIGNLVPRTAVDLLRSMRETLGEGSWLLIGIDCVKDTGILLRAYDDSQHITARFNLNLLHRINRELDADIPVENFRHKVIWNETYGRIEMHLEATQDMGFEIAGRRFFLRRGETIHTENSHKYSPGEARLLINAGGWTAERLWRDEADYFMLILARATEPRMAP